MTLDEARARYPGAETFGFGDSAELSASLVDLVRRGRKTATCGALRDFASDGEALPEIGRRDIALNWDGTPALAIETVSIEICRFSEVTEAFALAEGENDSLAGWQADHKAYFARNGGWAPDMKVVCETFRLVEDFAADGAVDPAEPLS
ncbi:MAG: ASCH domain-containing protein [Paracoccaceae bacterium]|nr:ASCH domain-containing protein [Paracoccaceae bacterium]